MDGIYRPSKKLPETPAMQKAADNPPTPTQARLKPTQTIDLFEYDDDDEKNLDDFHFKDILRAWFRQAIRNSPLEKQLKKANGKKKQLAQKKNAVKNDLKWALMADLDEPVGKRRTQRKKPDTSLAVHIRKFIGGLSKNQRMAVATVAIGLLLLLIWPRQTSAPNQSNIPAGSTAPVVQSQSPQASQVSTPAQSPQPSPQQTPTATTNSSAKVLLPMGKTTTDVFNYYHSIDTSGAPYYSYNDTFRGASIKVTERQVNDANRSGIVATLTQMAGDNTTYDKVTSGSMTIYIDKTNKQNQTVTFEKNGILITIQSSPGLENSAWSWFADNLG